jgi:hypothetical protein
VPLHLLVLLLLLLLLLLLPRVASQLPAAPST